jgi:hypothetical protein
MGAMAEGGIMQITDWGGGLDIARNDGVVRVRWFQERDPYRPTAYSDFLTRMSGLERDIAEWGLQTLVVDSTTFMELSARKWHQYALNVGTKEPRQWFAGSTDLLEEMLMMRLASVPINICVLAHIDQDRDELHGSLVRNPALPGRLRTRSPSGFSELYRAFIHRSEDGSETYALQTRSNEMYGAQSQIDAPNPCGQRFGDLWAGWGGAYRPPLHAIVMGQYGSGKSTFAATWPKPMEVCMFDPRGKELPYLKEWDPATGSWKVATHASSVATARLVGGE